jgi:hypothetical protein
LNRKGNSVFASSMHTEWRTIKSIL